MIKIQSCKKTISIMWILCVLLQFLSLNPIEVRENDVLVNNNYIPEQSATLVFWNLTGTFMETNVTRWGGITDEEEHKTIAGILIDEKLENFTWSKAAIIYPWCNGSGTKADPYIIDKVYIDGLYIGKDYSYYSNILIRHSRAHFIIRDCSLHKCGRYADSNAGIYLFNTTNGVLINNNLTYNRGSIELFESHNNIISGNRMLSKHDAEAGLGSGVYLGGYGNGNGSCNNIANDNIIINHYHGIVVFNSINATLSRNTINNTLFGHFPTHGISLSDTNYSSVTYNAFAGDYADYPNPYGDYIIDEQNCVGNEISDNFRDTYITDSFSLYTAQDSGSWFNLQNSNYNYIYGNILLKTNPETRPKIHGDFINILIVFAFLGIMIVIRSSKKLIIKNQDN